MLRGDQTLLLYTLLFFSPDPHASVVATSQPHVFSTPFHHGNTLHPNIASLLFTLPTNLKYSETRVQCVQGLLCFHPKDVRLSSHVDAFTLITNPTNRQVLAVTPDPSIHKDEFLVSTHFGFEPVRDEFKVLRLIKYQGSHEFKILTLGESSWRAVVLEKPFAVMHCLLSPHKRGVCVNGAIHWTYSSSFLTRA